MSDFNLLPWRERRRQFRLRHWRLAGLTSLGLTLAALLYLDQQWNSWLLAHQAQLAQRQQQLQALQDELSQASLWQTRQTQVQQVQAVWAQWRIQQGQAWQLIQHLLSVPPRGVQIERMVWRDHQLEINGWTLSGGHLQHWLSRLQADGLPARDARQRMEESQWLQAEGLAAKRHKFSLQVSTPAQPVSATP
jgi:Tfp pilus assembly protein PilN